MHLTYCSITVRSQCSKELTGYDSVQIQIHLVVYTALSAVSVQWEGKSAINVSPFTEIVLWIAFWFYTLFYPKNDLVAWPI